MLAAVAAATSSNPKRKLRISSPPESITTMLRLGKLLNDASETPAYSQSGRLKTAPPWADWISKSVCLPFGTQAVLIWRGEKNRGDHQTI